MNKDQLQKAQYSLIQDQAIDETEQERLRQSLNLREK
jgi:hypothetical protein